MVDEIIRVSEVFLMLHCFCFLFCFFIFCFPMLHIRIVAFSLNLSTYSSSVFCQDLSLFCFLLSHDLYHHPMIDELLCEQ